MSERCVQTRRWGWLLGTICALGVLLFVAWTWLAQDALEAALAETDALDPGWRLEEIQARREQLAPENNATLVAVKAADLLPTTWLGWSNVRFADEKEFVEKISKEGMETARRDVGISIEQLPAPVLLNKQQADALEGELALAKEALEAAKPLRHLRKGRLPNVPDPFMTGSHPDTAKLRQLDELLHRQAIMQGHHLDSAGATEMCHALINVAAAVGDEAKGFAVYARVLNRATTCATIGRLLGQLELPPAELHSLQKSLEQEESSYAGLMIAIRSSRTEVDAIFGSDNNVKQSYINAAANRSVLGQVWYRLPAATTNARAESLRLHNLALQIAKQPAHLRDWKQVASDDLLVSWLPKSFEAIARGEQTSHATLRSTCAALAAERFRQERGRWPTALAVLTPAYLARLPIDPFDGKPLRMRALPDGIVIYSVGADRADQNGKLRRDEGEMPDVHLDIGFRLWNASSRRQPPQPVITLRERFQPFFGGAEE